MDREDPRSWNQSDLPSLDKYQLLEVVGSGAFGTVYRARDTKLDRVVAVKVPRSGHFVSPVDEDRFVREARSVAQLSHPGVVAVHDVGWGTTFPFIVSEFVEGITLGAALRERRFSFREAAELVELLAEALDHAHQHGVIHRDLKPSNIMLEPIPVAGDAVAASLDTIGSDDPRMETVVAGAAEASWRVLNCRPRLMDFGLARREDGEVTVTLEGQVLGTPAYMSPEQARGDGHRVDGRSDVYSVGVILYELLAGELPFRGNSRMLLQQVLHEEPPPLRRQNDRLPRDLETVCLKCLSKDPGRRYQSAQALADDLGRFLCGEPVRARRIHFVEQAWRWCERRPSQAALGFLVLFVALLGCTMVGLQWKRAEQALEVAHLERRRAEIGFRKLSDASSSMLGVFEEWLKRMPEEEPARHALLNKSARLYEQFLRESPKDFSIRAETAATHERLADIYRMLGENEGAAQHYRTAVAIYRPLAGQAPGDAELQLSLARSLWGLGETFRSNGPCDRAESAFRQAIGLQLELIAEFPDRVRYANALARSYRALGLLLQSRGDPRLAELQLQQATNLLQSYADEHGAEASYLLLAGTRGDLGSLFAASNRIEAAEREYRRATGLLDELAREAPNEPEYRFERAVMAMRLADLLSRSSGDSGSVTHESQQEPRLLYQMALVNLQRLRAEYPGVPKYESRWADCANKAANLR